MNPNPSEVTRKDEFKLQHDPVPLSDEKLYDIEQDALDTGCGASGSYSTLASSNEAWDKAMNQIHRLLQHIVHMQKEGKEKKSE